MQDFFKRSLDFSGYIIWTGGEPFESFESLRTGLDLAASAGFHSEILSSLHWFPQHPDYLNPLVGTASLRISLDAYHQQTVPISIVIAAIVRAQELGIDVHFTLRDIPQYRDTTFDAEHSMLEIKQQLPEFFARRHTDSRWLHRIPDISYAGNPAPGTTKQTPRKRCPMAFRDVVIGENGLLYPCCGFFRLKDHVKTALGDPLTIEWETLTEHKTNHCFFTPCDECLQSNQNVRGVLF